MLHPTQLRVTTAVASTFLATMFTPIAATPASAATQWGGYQWSAAPAALLIYENIDPGWTTYVGIPDSGIGGGGGAVADWTNGSVGLSATRELSAIDRRKCPARTGTVEVCNYSYGRNGWLGIAQIWTSGNFIQKGTVKLNDSYFKLSAYNTAGWKSLVSCQEVGHTIGLGHDDTNFGDINFGTCMDYTSYPDAAGYYYDAQNARHDTADNHVPNGNDYALLSCIYAVAGTACPGATVTSYGNKLKSEAAGSSGGPRPHLHAGPTDFGVRTPGKAPSAESEGGNSPADWGLAVAYTHDGRGRVYERTVGPGRKVITEVFWAPKEP